jgi:hypothetical protein
MSNVKQKQVGRGQKYEIKLKDLEQIRKENIRTQEQFGRRYLFIALSLQFLLCKEQAAGVFQKLINNAEHGGTSP